MVGIGVRGKKIFFVVAAASWPCHLNSRTFLSVYFRHTISWPGRNGLFIKIGLAIQYEWYGGNYFLHIIYFIAPSFFYFSGKSVHSYQYQVPAPSPTIAALNVSTHGT